MPILRIVRLIVGCSIAVLVVGLAEPLLACPFCREALKNGDNRIPMAYQYSILFMLGMPPAIFGGIAFAIYRAFRKHAAEMALARAETPTAQDAEHAASQHPELV